MVLREHSRRSFADFIPCWNYKTDNMNARKIARYFLIYKEYLLDNNLEDDSKTITAKDLIFFVDNNIDPDDLEEYNELIHI